MSMSGIGEGFVSLVLIQNHDEAAVIFQNRYSIFPGRPKIFETEEFYGKNRVLPLHRERKGSGD